MITKYTEKEFVIAVQNSHSMKDLHRRLGMTARGSSYARLRKAIAQLNLDVPHWGIQKAIARKRNLNDYLVVDGPEINTHTLKHKLFKAGLLQNKCSVCAITDWQGQHLSLHMDHINGNSQDNRLENLRILCPNCHAQTSTYAGKNRNTIVRPLNLDKVNVFYIPKLCKCGSQIRYRNRQCKKCWSLISNKITWPSDAELAALVCEKPRSVLAQELGVSGKAIEKRCTKRNISQPPRGYWAKVAAGKLP